MPVSERLGALSAATDDRVSVRMPDGTVIRGIPRGTPKAEIERKWKQAKMRDGAASHPVLGPVTAAAAGLSDMMTFGLGDEISAGMESINPFNESSVWRGGSFSENLDRQRARDRQISDANPKSYLAGQVVGAVAPALASGGGSAVSVAPKAAGKAPAAVRAARSFAPSVAQGGAYAFGSAEGGMADRAKAMPEGMAWALAGDIAGRGVGKAVSRAIGGKALSPAQRALVDEDVLLTPGMRGGKVARFVEDRVMGSVPLLDNVPAQARDRSFASLRRAAANRVLKPLGAKVDDVADMAADAGAGSEFARNLNRTVYNAYDAALDNLALQGDQALNTSLDDVLRDAALSMTDDELKVVERNIGKVKEKLAKGTLTGKALRETMQDIRGRASKLAKTSHGDALWAVNNVLEDALDAQNGTVASGAYKKAREAVSLLKRYENAASRPGVIEGRFGPTQLKQAAQKRGFGTTDASVAGNTAPLLDLAQNAADVMRVQTANSGTIPRGMSVAGLLGAPAAVASVDPVMGGLLATQTLGYIPGIDRIIQNMAVNRPASLKAAADAIRRNNRNLGLLGVGGALSLSQ